MHSSSRGQAAFEYLINYSWVLMVVMLVGVILWQVGAISPDSPSMSSLGFSFFKLFTGMSEAKGGMATLYFQNNQGGTITFNITQSGVINPQTGVACSIVVIGPASVPSGEQFEILIQNDPNLPPCLPSDQDDYDLELNLIYDIILGGQSETRGEKGEIKGKQIPYTGTCTKTDNPSTTGSANYNKKGITCHTSNGCATDYCLNADGQPAYSGTTVFDFVCKPTFMSRMAPHLCPSGKCIDGACV